MCLFCGKRRDSLTCPSLMSCVRVVLKSKVQSTRTVLSPVCCKRPLCKARDAFCIGSCWPPGAKRAPVTRDLVRWGMEQRGGSAPHRSQCAMGLTLQSLSRLLGRQVPSGFGEDYISWLHCQGIQTSDSQKLNKYLVLVLGWVGKYRGCV